MNIYDAKEIKKAVSLRRYFKDQGVPLTNGETRAVAIWRDGKNPSVSISTVDGVELWHDHVTDSGGDVIAACVTIEGGTPLGAIRTLGDRYHVAPKTVARKPPKITRGEMLVQDGYALVITYTYTGADGKELYYVDRYERETRNADGKVEKVEKSFVQRSPTAENLDGVTKTIYNLPAVAKAQRVFVVEG